MADKAKPNPLDVGQAAELAEIVDSLAADAGRVFSGYIQSMTPAELKRLLARGFDEQLDDRLMQSVERSLTIAAMLGQIHIEDAGRAAGVQNLELADDPSEIPIPFDEAIDELRGRIAVDAAEFDELAEAIKARAFAVSRLSGRDAVRKLQEVLEATLEAGQSLVEFIQAARLDDVLEKAGFAEATPWYWETIYRTNATSAHTAGRWVQIRAMSDDIHAVEFVAIEDARTTAVCSGYAGLVRPADDDIWSSITPPNHFNCRSTIRAIFKGSREARETRLTPKRSLYRLPIPSDGFTRSPIDPSSLRDLPASMQARAREYGIADLLLQNGSQINV